MGAEETHGLGYERVDDDPNVQVLLATMGTTSHWRATLELRAWERNVLHLVEGERLLDVGCGLGEAAMTLAEDLGGAGEVVGIDVSSAMLMAARDRSTPPPCRVRFSIGDALALDEPDSSFDAARSERTLQWVADPQTAVDELARVVRPGGRVSLIDTDWSTFRIDVGDPAIAAMVREAMRIERSRPSNVGRRLGDLVSAAGLIDVRENVATQVWTEWNPDESPAPDGCFSMRSLADDLVDRGHLDQADTGHFISTIHDAARQGRFSMSLTMYALIALTPAST
jgi:ubiquinone/menaquinone biosynthesis C-methylase UbiE